MNQRQRLGSQELQRLHQRLYDQNIVHNCIAYERAFRKQLLREILGSTDWPVCLFGCNPNWRN